jgi:HAD superfamily hydrolase (TIGR01549 family)
MKFRGIVFDCDGVLIMNSNRIYDEALSAALGHVSGEVSEARLQEIKSTTRGKTFTFQLELYLGSKHPALREAIEFYERFIHSDENYGQFTLLDGVDMVLAELKRRGYVLAMATGMNPSLLERLLADRILPDIFERIASVHEIRDPSLQKPHPTVLTGLLTAVGLSPDETAYVGDTEDDIRMAKRCGVFAVAVLTGRLTADRSSAVGADLVLESALELPKWF